LYLPKIDIDECSTNNGGCHINANCINTQGSFSCRCNQGYIGNGFDCSGKNFYYFFFFFSSIPPKLQ